MITSKQFWVSTAERAVKTFSQALLALFVNTQANVLNVDWSAGLAVAGTAVLISVLTSLASSKFGPDNSPSLVGEPASEPDSIV